MTSQHNPATEQHPAVDAQRQLEQIAALVDEYAESVTGNADLTILLFQIRMVLGDDPAAAGLRISSRTRQDECDEG